MTDLNNEVHELNVEELQMASGGSLFDAVISGLEVACGALTTFASEQKRPGSWER